MFAIVDPPQAPAIVRTLILTGQTEQCHPAAGNSRYQMGAAMTNFAALLAVGSMSLLFPSHVMAQYRNECQFVTRSALQLMAILFPRPGELRFAERSEFDLDAAVWSAPPGRMKMRRAHRVALPRQAVDILRELFTAYDTKLAFPSNRSVHRPLSETTLNAALRRLGYSKDEATSHGF